MMDRQLDESYTLRRQQDDPALRFLMEQDEGAQKPTERRQEPDRAPAPPPAPATAAPPRGVLGTAGAVVDDVLKGVKEAPGQIIGGVRDAVVEAGQALNSLSDWMETTVPGWKALNRGKLTVKIGEVAKSEGVTSNLIRSASQFLTGFVPGMQATKAVGVTKLAVRGAAAGAAADATVFDPSEERVSNLVNRLAPALKNPVTEYLAAQPGDGEAEGRFKNALEGLGIGAVAEGVFRAVKLVRHGQLARRVERAESRATVLESPGVEPGPKETPIAGGRGGVEDVSTEQSRRLAEDVDSFRTLEEIAAGAEPVRIGREATEEEAGPLSDLAAQYQREVDVQRRGTRTHAQAAEEAEALGTTLEDVQAIMPGTALPDQEAVAVVKTMVQHGQQVKAMAADVLAGVPGAERAFLMGIYRHAQVDPKRLGIIAEAGRTLSVMNEPVSGMNRFLKQFESLFESAHRDMTPQRLAQMVTEFRTPEQLAGFARDITKPDGMDMLVEYFVNNLLWAPTTHAANVLSNALTTVWAPAERALAARIGSGEVARGEGLRMLYGIVTSQWDALRMAGTTAWTGESSSGLAKMEIRRRAISGDNLDMTGPFGRALDLMSEVTRVPLTTAARQATTAAGEVIRLPGRALLTADEYFRVVNYRAELRALSFREGMETATGEGLTGAARSRRAAEVMRDVLRDPPASIKRDAENFASYQTFTKELGEAGSHIAAALDAYPVGRIILPFYRTPVNLAKYGIERTPIALLADYPILRSIMPDIAADLRAGGAKRDLVLAKASLGSAVMAVTGMLAASGYITGRGPSDANVRREWLESHQPYSWKVGETLYAFNRLDAPIGMISGLAADAADALGNLPADQRDDLALVLAYAVGRNLTSKTYLKGVSEALNALADPERYGTNPTRNIVSGMVPFSSLLASIERADDPTLREARTLLDHVMSRIPGLSDDLPPRRNLYGEPVMLGGGLGPDIASPIYTKSATPNPVSDEIVRLRLSLDMPPRQLEQIELTPQEYDRFVVLAGREVELGGLGLKDRLEEVIGGGLYQRMNDQGKTLMIRQWVHAYRERAERELFREFPELGDAVGAASRERRRVIDRSSSERQQPSDPLQAMTSLIGSLKP